MQDPKITWYVKNATDKAFTQEETFYAGSYNKQVDMELIFEIWNNRYGLQKVSDLKNFNITIGFDHYEDSALLQYCFFEKDGRELDSTIDDGIMTVIIPSSVVISGKENDGSKQHTDNYIQIKMRLAIPDNVTIKPNDLKTMFFDIVNIQ